MSEIINFPSKKQELVEIASESAPQQTALDRLKTKARAEINDPEVCAALERALEPPKVIAFELPQRKAITPDEFKTVAELIALSLLLN